MEILKKLNSKKKIVAIIVIACVVVVGMGTYFVNKNKKKQAMADAQILIDTVRIGDVKSVTTGSASVEPYERYEIISMVSGDVISSPYEVGDEVSKGDILYQFDTETIQKSLRRQELSLEQSKNNLNNAKKDYNDAVLKLSIVAECDGVLTNFNLKKGNDVSNNQTLGNIEGRNRLKISAPFSKQQINRIYVGQDAVVSSSLHMSRINATVTNISSEASVIDGGQSAYNVTMEFDNPGVFTEGLYVGAEVDGMESSGFGVVEYLESATIKAEASGTVTSVNFSNGDYVKKGEVIATISKEALSSQERNLRNSELSYEGAELSMQETRDGLLDYSITSPINGTVITKNAKAGDTLDRTNSQTALMVVADISKLKFSMEIDELDIRDVHEGQAVDITCDALPGEKFVGEITSISVEGTATNGVTTYTAEVVINEPKNLRPSMNIDASIIIDSVENVLIVPVEDVKTVMGVSYVFQKEEKGVVGATEEDFQNAMRNNMTKTTQTNREGMPVPNMDKNSNNRENVKKNVNKESDNEKGNNNKRSMLPEAPDGFVVKIVTTGLSDDNYIQIISGLDEGDQIQKISQSSSNINGMMRMMQGMSGAMGAGNRNGAMMGGMR